MHRRVGYAAAVSDWLSSLFEARAAPGSLSLDDVLEQWSIAPGSAFERAVAVGARVDRLGHAFVAGYRSALLALSGESGHAAVCITEEGGGHPRAIRTSLRIEGDRAVLHGAKQWATMASHASTVLVAASTGEHEGRNQIRMARVPIDAAGLTWHPMPPTSFTPEIPHARITLEGVEIPAHDVLEGDGYARWIKPFRTIEDVHVMAAAAACLVGLGRDARWPGSLIAEGVAVIGSLASLAARPPHEPTVHLALGGVLASMHTWLRRSEDALASLDADVAARWRRDRPILEIAGRARSARFDRACERLDL